MTTTPIQVSTDLSKILEQINQKLDNLQKDVTDLKVGQAEIKGEIKALDERLTGEIRTLDERLTGEIKALDHKIDGIGKRLDYQEFISRGVLVALIITILGGFAKLFGLVGKP